jgi:hypothetical protein
LYTFGDGTKRSRINIVADSGKLLTNDGGVTTYTCVDVDTTDGWMEIDAPGEEISDTEALQIITGGTP